MPSFTASLNFQLRLLASIYRCVCMSLCLQPNNYRKRKINETSTEVRPYVRMPELSSRLSDFLKNRGRIYTNVQEAVFKWSIKQFQLILSRTISLIADPGKQKSSILSNIQLVEGYNRSMLGSILILFGIGKQNIIISMSILVR